MSLKKKYAIVTGGSRGIGRVIVEEFIRQGASVLICSRTQEEINKTCQELDPQRKTLFGLKADVSQRKDCKALIDFAVKRFGKIDILVNNAAIYGPIGYLETNSLERWKETIAINLLGTVFCSHFVISIMKSRRKGKIINLAGGGVGGKKPRARFSAYYTSKMAIVGFTEVLAEEVFNWNIQVNCISPGAINTYFVDYLLSQGKEKAGDEMYNQALMTKKSGGDDPKKVASVIAYLASSKANHITGKILSAKWETIEQLERINKNDTDIFTLRRIDQVLFGEIKNRH